MQLLNLNIFMNINIFIAHPPPSMLQYRRRQETKEAGFIYRPCFVCLLFYYCIIHKKTAGMIYEQKTEGTI